MNSCFHGKAVLQQDLFLRPSQPPPPNPPLPQPCGKRRIGLTKRQAELCLHERTRIEEPFPQKHLVKYKRSTIFTRPLPTPSYVPTSD